MVLKLRTHSAATCTRVRRIACVQVARSWSEVWAKSDVVAGAWQARGHLAADVDPLGITTAKLPELGMRAPRSELIMRKYFNFGTQQPIGTISLQHSSEHADAARQLRLCCVSRVYVSRRCYYMHLMP